VLQRALLATLALLVQSCICAKAVLSGWSFDVAVISRRTIGQIVLAYDDGTSPPVEVLPLGSLVSVADGTLWISQGGGVYDSVGSPQNYPDTTALPSPVPNAGTVASIGPGSPVARRTFYVSDGTQWVRAPDDAGLRYSASDLASLPSAVDGAQDGDQAFVIGTLAGAAIRDSGVWLWLAIQSPDLASLPVDNYTQALGYDTGYQVGYIWNGAAWERLPVGGAYAYGADTLANLPGAAEGALDGDVADLAGGTVTGKAVRTGGVWLWTYAYAPSFSLLPTDAVTGALGFVGQRIYVKTSTLWIIRPYDVALPLLPLVSGVLPVTIIDSFGLTNRASI
jgi:hypothetical protein